MKIRSISITFNTETKIIREEYILHAVTNNKKTTYILDKVKTVGIHQMSYIK